MMHVGTLRTKNAPFWRKNRQKSAKVLEIKGSVQRMLYRVQTDRIDQCAASSRDEAEENLHQALDAVINTARHLSRQIQCVGRCGMSPITLKKF